MELFTNQRIGEKAMPFHLRLCSVFSLPFSRFPLPFHWICDSRQVRGAGNAGRGSRRAGEEAAAATRKRGQEWRDLPAREVKQQGGVPPHLLERGDSTIGPLNLAAKCCPSRSHIWLDFLSLTLGISLRRHEMEGQWGRINRP